MNLTDYHNLFKTLAVQHVDIKHDDKDNPSFFTTEEQMMSTLNNKARKTGYVLYLPDYSGKLEGGSTFFSINTTKLMILGFGKDASDIMNNILIQDACMAIGWDIIGRLQDLYEDSAGKIHLPNFDINSVKHQTIGPYKGNMYGQFISFNHKDSPFNRYDIVGRDERFRADLENRVWSYQFDENFGNNHDQN